MNEVFNISALDYISSLPSKTIDFVIIDPPYMISTNRNNNNFKKERGGGGDQYRFGNLDLVVGEWDIEKLDFGVFDELYRILKNKGSLVCFFDVWNLCMCIC